MFGQNYVVKIFCTHAGKIVTNYITGLEGDICISPIVSCLDASYAYRFRTKHSAKKFASLAASKYKDVLSWKIVSATNINSEDETKLDKALIKLDTINQQIKDGTLSDGYHTFNDLYFERMILTATIVKLIPDKCWKTRFHEDGKPCFDGGWFLVTIETPAGNYGYHYEEKYWDYFKCEEIEKAKHWDGYTDKDNIRLLSLEK